MVSATYSHPAFKVGDGKDIDLNAQKITNGEVSGLTADIPVADGGTGSSTAAAARLALGVVDANDRMPAAMMPTKVLSQYWHASWDERTVVAGTWSQEADVSQTDYDPSLYSSAGRIRSGIGAATNDEIHFGSLVLLAGTYKVSFAVVKDSDLGIIEILHGTTSLGTFDEYAAGKANNVTSSFTHSPTTTMSGNLRFKCSGKNASSSAYRVTLSRLEIIRTA